METQLNLIVVITAVLLNAVTTTNSNQTSNCNACNCQLNNNQALSQLIEAKVAAGELEIVYTNFDTNFYSYIINFALLYKDSQTKVLVLVQELHM